MTQMATLEIEITHDYGLPMVQTTLSRVDWLASGSNSPDRPFQKPDTLKLSSPEFHSCQFMIPVLLGVTQMHILRNMRGCGIVLPPFLPPGPTALKVLSFADVNMEPVDLETAFASGNVQNLETLYVQDVDRTGLEYDEEPWWTYSYVTGVVPLSLSSHIYSFPPS
jgi:hypothetical protein